MSLQNEHYLNSINFFLSSNDADISHSSSHKTFYLDKPIGIPDKSHVMISLTSFNMPYSFYLIRSGINDSFKVSTYYESAWVEQTITIPEGNYAITEIVPIINTLFQTYQLLLRTTLNLVANYTTNKFYITSSVVMDTVLISDVLCYKILGLEKETTYTYSSASTINFPNCFDFSGNSCLYVVLRNHKIDNFNSAGVDGILQRINLECLPMEYIYFKPIEYEYFYVSSRVINSFEISILDENLEELELNGGLFRLTLTVHFKYDNEIRLEQLLNEEEQKANDEELKRNHYQLMENIKILEQQRNEIIEKRDKIKKIDYYNDNKNKDEE